MSSWSTVPLGEVASISRNSVDPRDLDRWTPYVGLENIEPGGRIIDVGTTADVELTSTKFRFTAQHVLFGKLRPYLAKIARPDFDGICSTDILPINPGSQIDRNYLAHFLSYPRTVDLASARASGANLPRLSPSELLKFRLPLPPLKEQQRIAEVLDRADELRAKRRQALSHLDDLTQSIFLDMFGDPVDNERAWPRVSMASLLHKIHSGQSPQCLDRPASSNEWGVLKLGAITRCEFDPLENKALPQNVTPRYTDEVRVGDILFSRKNTRELVAACALVRGTPPRLLLPDLIFRLELAPRANIDPVYLHQLLTYPAKRRKIQALAGGSAGSMPNISKSKLMTVQIELPPLSLQQEFAQRIEAAEAVKATQRKQLAELDALFASLQDRAFQGRL